MPYTLRPKPQEPEENNSRNQVLDTQHHVAIYPRVSSPEQLKNVSAEMQQDKTFALKHGWLLEMIIMDTSDLGLSGQLRMEDRPAFVNMLRLIEDGIVKTVIVAQVDRLFRDRWGQEYSKFMEICYTYDVKVVTLTNDRKAIDFVYDFSVTWHVDQFRRECEASWRYIEKQIRRMTAARDELAQTGHWAGGGLNVGYIPDPREFIDGKKNPKHLVYVPYSPHVSRVIWLFERFRQLEGSVRALFVETQRLPFLFEPFDGSVNPEVVSRLLLKKVFDESGQLSGYTIAIPKSLVSILCNPVYIGYWIHKGQIVSTNHHEPLVDFDLFMYAFTRLSPVNLDGTPNQEYLEKISYYAKRHFAQRPAYLKNHAVCADEALRIYEKAIPSKGRGEKADGRVRTLYAFIRYKDHTTRQPRYAILAEDVDGIFFGQLKRRLEATKVYSNYLDHEEAELKIQARLLKDVKRDMKAVESVMKKITNQIASGAITNTDLLKAANDSYTIHQEELERLKEREHDIETNSARVAKRRTYKQLILQLKALWVDTYPPEKLIPTDELPMLVDTFVTQVVFECLSNHFYTMSIYWRDPEWGIDELLCFRSTSSSHNWAKQEDDIIQACYLTTPKSELMKLLPDRSYGAITSRANSLGIHRAKRIYSGDDRIKLRLHKCFSLNDCQVIEKYQLAADQVIQWRKGVVARRAWKKYERGNLDTSTRETRA